jgi:hypothetical protein
MTCLLIVDALQRLNEHQRLCAIFESWPTLTHFAETWFRYARSSQICGQTARARMIFQRLRQGEFRALTTREGCESWRAGLELIRLALLEHQPAEAFALWPQIAAEIPGNQRQTLQILRDSLERLQAIAHTDHRSSI